MYQTRQYGSNARWLLKALREVPYTIEECAGALRGSALTWTPEPGAWSGWQYVVYLRESAREDLAAVRGMLRRDGSPLAVARAEAIANETAAPGTAKPAREARRALGEFFERREELLWLLDERDEDWERGGVHPYRGRVTLSQYVHEITERDLEVMWALQRLAEAHAAAG